MQAKAINGGTRTSALLNSIERDIVWHRRDEIRCNNKRVLNTTSERTARQSPNRDNLDCWRLRLRLGLTIVVEEENSARRFQFETFKGLKQ